MKKVFYREKNECNTPYKRQPADGFHRKRCRPVRLHFEAGHDGCRDLRERVRTGRRQPGAVYFANAEHPGFASGRNFAVYERASKDFSGFIIVMSKRFAGDLPANMRECLSLRLAFADSPGLPLSSPELEAALSCCDLLRKTKQIKDVSACKEIDKLFDARLQGICRILFSPQARSEDFLSGFSKT